MSVRYLRRPARFLVQYLVLYEVSTSTWCRTVVFHPTISSVIIIFRRSRGFPLTVKAIDSSSVYLTIQTYQKGNVLMDEAQLSKRHLGRWLNAKSLLLLISIAILTLGATMHFTRIGDLVAFFNSLPVQSIGGGIPSSDLQHRRLSDDMETIPVYTHLHEGSSLTVRKQVHGLKQTIDTDKVRFEVRALNINQQQTFVQQNCNHAAARFDTFTSQDQEFLAVEVFKWCALSKADSDVSIFLDAASPLIHRLHDTIVQSDSSILVLADEELFGKGAFTTGLVVLRRKHEVAIQMLKVLLDTPLDILQISPLHIPKTLFSLIRQEDNKGVNESSWTILQSSCPEMHRSKTNDISADRLLYDCPRGTGFCCYIHDGSQTLSVSRYPVLPVVRIPETSSLPKPLNSNRWSENELPYITTLKQGGTQKKEGTELTIYEKLQKDCSPKVLESGCSKCLRDKSGADCDSCGHVCKCFCEKLCTLEPPEFETTTYYITSPVYARDSRRLIPRIVHQTWFEHLQDDREKYPNMSRLTESFRKSGWEYKFYSDDDSVVFLDAHFPPAVREAYDALNPGAFKADLFRYCVLLIYGGIYADVDILLETSLDSIPSDVGFMVPLDEVSQLLFISRTISSVELINEFSFSFLFLQ